ncbi:helix-turn-helix domain containing protein [Streptomyces sp. PSRA5]|uniref:helix-turn-helix domain-containing protein n=1 Tax=Streptomyces panacea TaxID=3035064 RepID=UPI00339C2C84
MRQIAQWLTELPRQMSHLRHALTLEGRPAQGRVGGSATAPIPVNLSVLNLLGPGWPTPPADPYGDTTGPVPIGPLLAGWAGYIAYQHQAAWRDDHGTQHNGPCVGAHSTRGADVAGWCHWLAAYLPYAAEHTWVRDLYQQLDTLMARVYDLTHAVPHRHRQAAPCPNCRGYALVQIDGQFGISCDVCGHHLTPEQYTAHAQTILTAHPAPGDTEMPADTDKLTARRAAVLRLSQENKSLRAIATELGIGKDTVARDLEHLSRDNPRDRTDEARQEPATPETPTATPAPPVRHPVGSTRATHAAKAARAGAAMRQLATAVAEVVAARVPYTMVSDQVAHDWAAELRKHAAQLTHERQQFADYYSDALIAGAAMRHQRTSDETPATVAHPAPTAITRDIDPAPPALRLRVQPEPDDAA